MQLRFGCQVALSLHEGGLLHVVRRRRLRRKRVALGVYDVHVQHVELVQGQRTRLALQHRHGKVVTRGVDQNLPEFEHRIVLDLHVRDVVHADIICLRQRSRYQLCQRRKCARYTIQGRRIHKYARLIRYQLIALVTLVRHRTISHALQRNGQRSLRLLGRRSLWEEDHLIDVIGNGHIGSATRVTVQIKIADLK